MAGEAACCHPSEPRWISHHTVKMSQGCEKKIPFTNIFWQYMCYSLLQSPDICTLRPLKMLTMNAFAKDC
jgi:hypothetical protein